MKVQDKNIGCQLYFIKFPCFFFLYNVYKHRAIKKKRKFMIEIFQLLEKSLYVHESMINKIK